ALIRMRNTIIAITASSLLTVVIILFAVYGFGYLQRGTADFRGETSQIEQTKANADYRISAYDEFYDSCASVKSIEKKIKNIEDELEETEESQRKTTLKTSITASKNKRAELIESYNADARKEATRGQFKASDLPYELNIEEDTICEVN